MTALLLAALVVLAYVTGLLTQRWLTRPPEVPSPAYFMERDWPREDETEMRRRTVRAAIEDWREAYDARPAPSGPSVAEQIAASESRAYGRLRR